MSKPGEKKRIFINAIPASIFLVIIWLIKILEVSLDTSFHFLAVYPLNVEYLHGILTSPLIHSDFKHLFANSIPLFVLGWCLFYFYKEIAIKTSILIYILTGMSVWLGAREAFHLGASGVVYGLASFLFFSGIFRRNMQLLTITMLVVFLYGSMVWGVIPDFFPEKNISWESHLFGGMVGFVLSVAFLKEGPQRKKYDWEYEEEEDEEEEKIDDKESHPHFLF